MTWLWGGFSVDNPTLEQVLLSALSLPFVIVGVVVLHLVALHRLGQTTRWALIPRGPQDTFHSILITPSRISLACLCS